MQYLIKPVSEEKPFEVIDKAIEKVTIIEETTAKYSIYPDNSGVQIQAKEEKCRKTIKEFLLEWFQRSS